MCLPATNDVTGADPVFRRLNGGVQRLTNAALQQLSNPSQRGTTCQYLIALWPPTALTATLQRARTELH